MKEIETNPHVPRQLLFEALLERLKWHEEKKGQENNKNNNNNNNNNNNTGTTSPPPGMVIPMALPKVYIFFGSFSGVSLIFFEFFSNFYI